ncbi:MAG TPA: hypothetical protein VI461_15210 [Chitinophagaceae bacterium]|nr:hypothetical protein [Chitinophagaceae bacterium]
MRKLILLPVIFIAGYLSINGQQQSAIYDATIIMNAKYGLNVFLMPLPATDQDRFQILNAETGQPETLLIDSLTNMPNLTATVANSSNATNSRAVILEVLRRNAGLAVGSSESTIMAAYAGNPFLSGILTYTPPSLLRSTNIQSVDGYPASSASGSLGSNLLGNLVNGAADFLIKRAHEEISVSVIERLKKLLELYPEFLKLFPRTCSLLEPIKPYEYSKALAAFKAAIKEDMENFIAHISGLYDIPRYQLLNQKVPALSLLFTASTLLAATHDEKNFATSMAELPSQPFMSASNNYISVVQLLIVISNSLLDQKLSDPDDDPIRYINKLYISKVTHKDPALMDVLSRAYLGLLWHKASSITFVTSMGPQNVATFLNRWNVATTIESVIKLVDKAVGLISISDKELKEVKESEQETRRITGENHIIVKRFNYYAALVSGVLDIVTLFQDPANSATTRIGEIRDYLPQFTTSVSSMIKNIAEEEYNLAISSFEKTLTVLSDYLKTVEKNKTDATTLKSAVATNIDAEILLVNGQLTTIDGDISGLSSGGTADVQLEREARRQEYLVKKAQLEKKKEQLERQKKNLKAVVFKLSKIINYVNLLAAITKAENSEAVEKLLETYALPAGSSRIKKVTSFNIAVNSYVGGFFGRSDVSGSGFTNRYGFTAPIGFTFSTGFYKGGSASLFLSVFDIGGTVRYKLNNQGKYEQNITLAGIVSPGIHLVYGFPFYLPVSAGLGYQWVSPVTENTNDIHLKSSFNAFIGVDIPLFNLTRSR